MSKIDKVRQYIDDCLRSITRAPGMWGQNETIECQTLLLLELRAVALGADPGVVGPAWQAHCAQFIEPSNLSLSHALQRAGRDGEFWAILNGFVAVRTA